MPDHDLLVRAARLYFELGETQEHVAEQLGVNRPQVSRLLKEARACGIVEIRINDGSPPDGAVADAIGERFGLRSVHLVARLGGPEDLTRRLVAQEAARILRERIRDGMIVGVGGGATTGAAIEALADQPVQADVTVVPLTGGMSGSHGPTQLVLRLADILGGLGLELPAPGVMESAEVRDALCRHVAVDAVLRVWGQLDVALVGVGVPSWSPTWFGSAAGRSHPAGRRRRRDAGVAVRPRGALGGTRAGRAHHRHAPRGADTRAHLAGRRQRRCQGAAAAGRTARRIRQEPRHRCRHGHGCAATRR